MVAGYILALHFIAALYIFTRQKKKGALSDALLALGFMGIIFAVGWTISTMLTNLLFMPEFFLRWYYAETDSLLLQTLRKEFNRDAISLLILTFGEVGFYYFYLGTEKEQKHGEDQSPA